MGRFRIRPFTSTTGVECRSKGRRKAAVKAAADMGNSLLVKIKIGDLVTGGEMRASDR